MKWKTTLMRKSLEVLTYPMILWVSMCFLCSCSTLQGIYTEAPYTSTLGIAPQNIIRQSVGYQTRPTYSSRWLQRTYGYRLGSRGRIYYPVYYKQRKIYRTSSHPFIFDWVSQNHFYTSTVTRRKTKRRSRTN